VSRADRATSCPTCGAPADRGQLMCLECGSRIALSYRRPPSWKVPVAISAVLLVLAGAGAVLGYQALDEEAEQEVAAVPARVDDDESSAASTAEDTETDQSETTDTQPETETEPETPTETETAPQPNAEEDGLVEDGPLYTWPRSLRGFTVVLLSNEDRPSAASFARSAAATRPEKIGVIRSDDFSTLPTGFFVVFAGRYDTRAEATRAASRLGASFPGAFPQLVRR